MNNLIPIQSVGLRTREGKRMEEEMGLGLRDGKGKGKGNEV